MDEKRKALSRALIYRLVTMVICFSIIFIGYFIDDLKKEKLYSNSLKEGTKVYVNVMDITPDYTVSSSIENIKNDDRHYACLCHSEEGDKFYLYVDFSEYIDFYLGEYDYDDFNGSPTSLDFHPSLDLDAILERQNRPDYSDPISYNEAVQVHGRIRNADSLADNLSEKIGTDHVILYDYLVYDDFSTK